MIHTDFERGFIKAEVVSYDDLIAAGSMAAAKAAGKVRMEGKDYVMADGDVVEFRFNVWRQGRRSVARPSAVLVESPHAMRVCHVTMWQWTGSRRLKHRLHC